MGYNEEREKQQNIIIEKILSYDQANCEKFTVFSCEAGMGKTYALKKGLVSLWNKDKNIKSLVVRLFIEGSINNPESLSDEINQEAGADIAVSVCFMNKKRLLSELMNKPVVIITHKQYLSLCYESAIIKEIKSITDNRRVIEANMTINPENIVDIWMCNPGQNILVCVENDSKTFCKKINHYIKRDLLLDQSCYAATLPVYTNKIEIPIIVIDKSKYFELKQILKKSEIDYFIEDRTNLIIDEELQILHTYKITQSILVSIKKLIEEIVVDDIYGNYHLLSEFLNVCNGLESEMVNSYYGMKLVNNEGLNTPFPRYLVNIKKLIEETILILDTEEYSETNSNKGRGILSEHGTRLKDAFNLLENYFYHGTVLVSNYEAYSYNEGFSLLMLMNNILLDASANFNYIYKLSNIYDVIVLPRIKEHNSTLINFCKMNSTKSSKNMTSHIGFHYAICEHIISNYKKNDKILIVGLKDEIILFEQLYKELLYKNGVEFIQYTNFQALRGKNKWKEFNKCYIIHTPNLNYCMYVMLYKLYKGLDWKNGLNSDYKILRDEDLALTVNEYGNQSFINEEIERVRKTYIASNIYQAIMRINRLHRDNSRDIQGNDLVQKNTYEAEIYIINSDEEIADIIKQQLKDCKTAEFELNMPKDISSRHYSSINRFVGSYIDKFIRFLETYPSGQYTKEFVRTYIEWKYKNSFRKKVINRAKIYLRIDEEVDTFMVNNRVIHIDNRHILISQYEDRELLPKALDRESYTIKQKLLTPENF